MESISNEGMCRCCASEGTFKDFLTTYHWMGEEEIYADMLRDCFAITLYTSDDFNNGGICEVCITQLRNACNFKRQVQQTEEQFKKRVQNSVLKCNVIKLEMAGVDDGEHSDTNLSDEFSVTEFEVPIKEEKVEEKPKKRQAAKPSTSRAKKAKTEDGEPSAKRKLSESVNKEDVEDNKNRSTEENMIKIEITRESKKRTNVKSLKKIKLKPIKELSKHHHNIKEVLQWSNTTPIHGKSDLGYLCCYCSDKFPDPADLKKHTLQLHKNDPKPKFLQKRDLKKYHVKVDITGLQCDICKLNIQSIDDLIDHLRNMHDRKIYTDVKNHIVSFKFEESIANELKCIVCSNTYTKFKILFEHMHKHSRNYVCDVCSAGFINNRALLNHQKRHNLGEFKCEHCDKVFDNLHKKNSHVTTVHVHGYLLNKCGYCNQKFAGYRTKAEHLRTAHGITERAKCQACEKSFSTKDSLNKHIKRHHLMDYRYSCTLCDMKFHANKSLEEHMVKHTKTRSFQCKVCFKRYGRQQTLKEHMRIHDNDRRFKCEHCVMAFVQKCSWRRHMQAKHDDQV
nr:zinc finger protein 675-like isoform X6 [Vanessa tameamea]